MLTFVEELTVEDRSTEDMVIKDTTVDMEAMAAMEDTVTKETMDTTKVLYCVQ